MTQPEQRIAIPQGLDSRRRMHWSVLLLLVGMGVSIVATAGYIGTLGVRVNAEIDEEFPLARRQAVSEKMSKVSKLLKETVLLTECPVLPSVLDPIQKKGKILKAQFGQHHGVIVPYVGYQVALTRKRNYMDLHMMSDILVQYKFTSDEQLDLFLEGVAFDVDDDHSVHGVHEASQKLFGKTPENLTPAEVALLASAINYPRPFERAGDHPTREQILRKMRDQDLISAAELEVALGASARDALERYPASTDD